MLHIVLDKSVIQSLSYDEGVCLSIYYYQCLTPVLFLEILADLAKFEDTEKAENEVGKISSKLSGTSAVVNDDALFLIKMNLLGYEVRTDDHRPFISGGYWFKDDEGKTGYFLDEQPEATALRNWEYGKFEDDHNELAQRWRELTKGVDLVKMKSHLKNIKYIPKVNDISELKNFTTMIADAPMLQSFYLHRLIDKVGLSKSEKKIVLKKYGRNIIPIKCVAPYAYHCLCVDIAFCIALKNEIIGTRRTNVCDMMYLYYMPFSRLFSTCDNTQFRFASALFGDEKDIIRGQDLKDDLQKIIRIKDEQNGGVFPTIPPRNTLTGDLWGKYFGALEDSSKPITLTPEAESRLVKLLRKKIGFAETAKANAIERSSKK